MKTFLKILTLFIAVGAISNVFFVLGAVEVVCAVICIKKTI